MASLYVAEFVSVGGTSNFNVAGALVPPIVEQKLAISASAAQGSLFNSNTRFIRVETDAICSIAFGTNPTATASNMRLAANQIEYFSVPPTGTYTISVITNT